MNTIERKISELGLVLPDAPPPGANYIPHARVGNIVYVSGQVSLGTDSRVCGTLGIDVDVDEGRSAARLCALNLLSQVKAACDGDLDRLTRVIKLTGFVNSAPDFEMHPAVINGASDFLVEVMGDAGRHTRSAVGVAALPFNFAVEIEGIFEISDSA